MSLILHANKEDFDNLEKNAKGFSDIFVVTHEHGPIKTGLELCNHCGWLGVTLSLLATILLFC